MHLAIEVAQEVQDGAQEMGRHTFAEKDVQPIMAYHPCGQSWDGEEG